MTDNTNTKHDCHKDLLILITFLDETLGSMRENSSHKRAPTLKIQTSKARCASDLT